MQFKPITTQDEWDWVWSRAYPLQCADSQGIVAYDDKGIQAVCVADSFTIDSCQVHVAIDNPLVIKYGFLHEVFTHLFHVCGRKRVFGLVPANNEKAIKFDTHIGFEEVSRIPHAYAEGVDYIVFSLAKDQCRWIHKERQEEAA